MKPIDPARWAAVRALFEDVAALAPHDRARHLDRACAGDAALRATVEEMLAAHDAVERGEGVQPAGADAFADSLLAAPAAPDGSDPRVGTTIGRYRLLARLGAGGMGVVYEAEQDRPRRRVAIKLMRPDSHHDPLGERLFAREVEMLARLRHPGIATIHEAGTTPEGAPYFAMELVEGVTLDRHLREGAPRPEGDERVPPARTRREQFARIDLFLEIGDAIQHAHQRGVIHRDLKPSNVLVLAAPEPGPASAGGPGPGGHSRIKVLDFGLARRQDADASRTWTGAGAAVQGTLGYMSPEQARGDADAVDVRSDVYALGVMLYEMLTGRLPVAVRSSGDSDALRRIAEQPPVRPSVHVPSLRGDLEVVMLHALAKSPDERYASVDAFAEDLRRVRQDLPILARRPSLAAQVRSVVRRHRAVSVLAAALAVALVAFGATMAVLGSRALRAERVAARQAARAERVSEFMVELFRASDPGVSRGDTLTARALLDAGARRVSTELAGEPDVQAALLQSMGRSYLGLGLYDAADTLLGRAVNLAERSRRPATESSEALRLLAEARLQRGDYASADEILDRAERRLGPRGAAGGADDAAREALTDVRGALRMEQGRLAESESLKTIVLESRRRRLGPRDPETLRAAGNLAASLMSLGAYAAAAETLEHVLALREATLGRDHPDVATTLNELAMANRRLERLDRAESLFVRGIASAERSLGPDHPDLAYFWNNLGLTRRQAKDLPGAEAALRRAVAIRERGLPPDHPLLAWTLDNLALTLTQRGRLAEAERTIQRAIAIASRSVPADHIDHAVLQNNLASLREAQGRLREAKALRVATIPAYERTYGPDSPGLATTLGDLATTLEKLGETREALRLRERQVPMLEHVRGPDDRRTVAAREALAALRARLGGGAP